MLIVGRWRTLVAMVVLSIAASCSGGDSQLPAWQRETAHSYASPTIEAANVDKLGVAWEFSDFIVRGRTHRGVEATPVVVDGTMYMSGPWSVVYALDAKTGRQLWRYDPEVDGHFARRTCCDVVNRGVAVADGRVYVATLDGYLAALDARTGAQLWKVDTLVDRTRSYAITGAPRVAGNTVVIGNGGAEMGVRGYASAYDRRSGKLAWRFFVVPGDPAKGDEHPEVAEARKTWSPNSRWDLGGGGTVWDSIVYDPDTNLVFLGTGNGMPHPAWTRSPGGGDNLYLSSIVAVDADSGRKKWHYQTTPADSWDYTATQNMVLADIRIGDRVRKVVMQAPKNGFFYVLDRVSGELLSAEKYTMVTWADRVDLKTGRPVLSAQGDFSKSPKMVWPSEAGGHNWQPMAYSARTGLVYIPVLEAPMIMETKAEPYRPYSPIQGSIATFSAFEDPASAPPARAALFTGQPKSTFYSVLKAWNPVTNKVVWSSAPQPFFAGGAMVTDSNLVIQGTADGIATIYDAVSGKVLRRIDIGTAIMSSAMSYTIDGIQYVAIAAGFGGALNVSYPPGSIASKRENTERLLVFKLGGAAPRLPVARAAFPYVAAPMRYRGSAAMVQRGAALYEQNCSRCHGGPDTVGGYPNLWKMTPETHDAFDDIVLRGLYVQAGMASFADVLSPADAKAVHAFLSNPVAAAKPADAEKKNFH